MLVMGIDLGTSGTRVMVVDPNGQVIAWARTNLKAGPALPAGWREQDPLDWWRALRLACRRALTDLRSRGRQVEEIRAVSVTSTSGTVVLLDGSGSPLRPALMYNDSRAGAEAREVDETGRALWSRLGYRMNASFALPKLLWLKRHEPENWERARYVVHAADYLAGRMTGQPGVSDFSNCLKAGYDLVGLRWPTDVLQRLDLDLRLFPAVVAPGESMGSVCAQASAQLGLPQRIPVVAGMTDGCASQIAAGAVQVGAWSTTIGSTLVVKGVSRSLICDPTGAVYCHRHPEGYWMPGGAGNTGGAVLVERFGRRRLSTLSNRSHFPTSLLCYPLVGKGERFPFLNPQAEGFVFGEPTSEVELFAAHLEGIACVERLAYDRLKALGAEVSGPVASSGGGGSSPVWLQVRADVLGRTLALPQTPEASFGAAVIAVAHVTGATVSEAAATMVRTVATYEPRSAMVRLYDDRYARFVEALRERQYI